MMMKNQHPFHLIPAFSSPFYISRCSKLSYIILVSSTVGPYPRVWPKQMVIAAIHGGMALRRMCKLRFVRF